MGALDDSLKLIRDKILANKAHSAAIGLVYKFALDGEGGGSFIFRLKDEPDVFPGDGHADCTLRMSVQDGLKLLQGQVSGQELFFSGRLKIEGDVILALRLESLLKVIQ